MAAKRNGPRFIKMDPEERKSFSNLILLCHPHHTLVDRVEPEKYSIELLQEWKAQREGPEGAALRGVRDLTEERLLEMILEAIVARDKRIDEAIKRFEEVDFEAARVLRDMLEELNYLRTHGSVLDPDVVSMLHDAATTLRPNVNEDTVGGLWHAANVLQNQNLHDTAEALNAAASELSNIPDLVVQLQGIVQQLQNARGYM
ncbi:hypothetical protein D0T12_31235 [Actinomadura spongiicola]|uniref:HNH endonuclease n=1 Tax=Actinomadura spongiicola TaxID=2303421 RepID=A0A372G7U6_9ACTN|nr:hypothetical protein D0T12_31235 [Actinomadura spongiicola]